MKKSLKICVVAIAVVLVVSALIGAYFLGRMTNNNTDTNSNSNGNGNTNTYTITYLDAPSHSNPTTYTSSDNIKLQNPMWTGLSFSHWSDEDGNVITEIPRGTKGDITLTANWIYTENMIVSNDSNDMLFSIYDEENNQRYFVYELGTIHNVVLDELSSYKYNGATNHTWSISETVKFTESSAQGVAKTIADCTSKSTSWHETTSKIKENSTNKQLSATIAPELEIKAVNSVKAKLGEFYNGIDTLTSNSTAEERYDGETTDSSHEESSTISSTVSYTKDVTTQITRSEALNPSITPAGLYRYVQAGSVKVFAIVTYNPDTKDYYINIYSCIVQAYETMLYKPILEYNNDTNIVESDPFEFDLDIDGLAENVVGNSYYVQFKANGGTGSMLTQMIPIDTSVSLNKNQFTREGYEFIGWSNMVDDSVVVYTDGQTVSNIATIDKTITLYAVWYPVTYKIVYDANGGTGSMSPTIHTLNEENTLPVNAYTKLGYVFKGWNTKPDGSGTSYSDKANIKNLAEAGETVTLYAMWDIIGSKGLKYTLNNDNKSYSVTGIGTCTDKDIVIPSVYSDFPVTSIGDSAFIECTSLQSITIPESIKSIGNNSFKNCTNLTSINFSEDSQLTSIGNSAFYKCQSLISVTIPKCVTSIGNNAFRVCNSLKSVIFKNTSDWWCWSSSDSARSISSTELANPATAAEYLTVRSIPGGIPGAVSGVGGYYWERR